MQRNTTASSKTKALLLPPCARSRRCISGLWRLFEDESEIIRQNVNDFVSYCKIILKSGGYAVVHADFFMIDEGI